MKVRNVSKEEQKVMPNDGVAPFSCAPGAESPELSDVCAQELVASLPLVWALVSGKPPKKSKKEN